MAGEQVHGGQAAVRLHELQIDGVQALVEAGLEGVDIPASLPVMLRWCHDSRPKMLGPDPIPKLQSGATCMKQSGGNGCWWLRADCTLPMCCYSAHRRILGVR